MLKVFLVWRVNLAYVCLKIRIVECKEVIYLQVLLRKVGTDQGIYINS